jgi:hypothetical protein
MALAKVGLQYTSSAGGVDRFSGLVIEQSVTTLNALNTSIDLTIPCEQDLRVLAGLKKLRTLDTGFCETFHDLSPLRGMALTQLILRHSTSSDLSALRGMPLTYLNIWRWNQLSDLSPLRGMRLNYLDISHSLVSDLTPLRGMPLSEYLGIVETNVSDLSPLHDMPLRELDITGTRVTDLSPLVGMPLRNLYLSHTGVTDLSPLNALPLERLNLPSTADRRTYRGPCPNVLVLGDDGTPVAADAAPDSERTLPATPDGSTDASPTTEPSGRFRRSEGGPPDGLDISEANAHPTILLKDTRRAASAPKKE